jgi:predicted acylesterase/phospholipase RssA
MTRLLHVVWMGLVLTLSGCAPFDRMDVTPDEAGRALLTSGSQFRFFADAPLAEQRARFARSVAGQGADLDILALSGGGPDGAFGAGIVVGWTEGGDRPEFDIVTGISIGAIVAPYAFLGSSYDDDIADLIQRTGTDFGRPVFNLLQLLRGGGAFLRTDLQSLVATIITPQVVAEIAAAHQSGRRLYVATTHLDAQRLAIWDLGALAQLGYEQGGPIIQGVIAASASIPGVFPPVRIRWPDAGGGFEGLHVDGGTIAQIWVPDPVLLRAAGARGGTVYAILNNRLEPTYEVISPDTASVASTSASILFRSGSHAELAFIRDRARIAGFRFRLAYIGPDDPASDSSLDFELETLTKVFNASRAAAVSQSVWRERLPQIYREAAE